MNAQPLNDFDAPAVVFSCRVCEARFDGGYVSRPRARGDARAVGWDFLKVAEEGNVIEHWFCPAHVNQVREKLNKKSISRIVAWSDENASTIGAQIEEQIRRRQNDRISSHSRFERYFGPMLTGNEMAASMRLRGALEIVEIAGNATASYDGIGVDSFNYGSKTLQERVIDASHYKRNCQTAVTAGASADTWRLFLHAVWRDFSPQDAGDMWYRLTKKTAGRDKRMEDGAREVKSAAEKIVGIRY